ncbi:MAG: hypothetical protein KC776_19870 [Myxococcales bacterium]|nr:hypothetical protein [Myxococcales bacterium]MCB9576882.1 hypothetical protein [Polyangiaceae bacterium]
MNTYLSKVWKWNDRLVVFPAVGTMQEAVLLNQPIPVPGGYRRLASAIRRA